MLTTAPVPAEDVFLEDVVRGLSLSRKELPSRYFYDDVGSALFEAITALPEYGLTRADERLLRDYAPAIANALEGRFRVAELGCGSGRKTRWLLEALRTSCYHPIDVSPAALDQCRRELSPYAGVQPFAGTFLEGMKAVASARGNESLLVLFLGSTIGNFANQDAIDFLRAIRALLRPGDAMLIGFDLVKDSGTLLNAYDDPAGVTAAFNRNLLARINRECGADFDLRTFTHEARYVENCRRVEMHLRSISSQTVTIARARRSFHFTAGETIWTESSHKYRPEDISALARLCGFEERLAWTDSSWPFTESLWTSV
jgi:L-histidine N-alpha-methyltransferase